MDWIDLLTINPGEQRELVDFPSLLQKTINLLGRRRPLQHLAVHFLFLYLLNADAFLHAHLSAPVIPAAATTCNQICHTRTLFCKCSRTHGVLEEHFTKLPHFEKPYTHHRGFGVVAPLLANDEASSQSDDVLESTTKRHAYRDCRVSAPSQLPLLYDKS